MTLCSPPRPAPRIRICRDELRLTGAESNNVRLNYIDCSNSASGGDSFTSVIITPRSQRTRTRHSAPPYLPGPYTIGLSVASVRARNSTLEDWVDSDNRYSMQDGDFRLESEFNPTIVSYDVESFTWGSPTWIETAAVAVVATAVVPYVSALAQELAKKTVEGAPAAYRRIHARLRYNRKGIKSAEIKVSLDGGPTTVVVLIGELSDQAHLALMDLNFLDSRVAGKVIYWDANANSWVPIGPIKRRTIWRKRLK